MALRLNRVRLGTYGDAKNAQRRLDELNGAFEDESDEWVFEREGFNREQTIWVYYPENDGEDWSNHDKISAFIRKKSIAYRQAQRIIQANKLKAKENKTK